MKKRLSASAYIEGVRQGDRLTLSRAITLVESTLPSDVRLAREVIQACMPLTGNSIRFGITGVPGVGKSTFIDSFGMYLADQLGKKVAVLAIDPSSQRTHGSILGDKTRMNRLSHHPSAFIRPSPTAGNLGGVSRKTRESLLLCEAAGFEVIIIETVGVGQSETAVRDMVDFFLLLMLPNAGDELQGIKKGIMEMADLLAVNKADGKGLELARHAKVAYSQALRLFPPKESGWKARVSLCSGLQQSGIEEIWKSVGEYEEKSKANGYWKKQRSSQAIQWFEDVIFQQLQASFYHHPYIQEKLQQIQEEVILKKRSPVEAASKLVEDWLGRNSAV